MQTLSVEVVRAFVDPLVELVSAWLGLEARSGIAAMSREIDPPPAIAVTIVTAGGVSGGITWTFSEALARHVAARLLGCEPCDIDDAMVLAAASELANLAAGNATERLRDAGFLIEIGPPLVHAVGAPMQLLERAVAVTIETSCGNARVMIALVETADVG